MSPLAAGEQFVSVAPPDRTRPFGVTELRSVAVAPSPWRPTSRAPVHTPPVSRFLSGESPGAPGARDLEPSARAWALPIANASVARVRVRALGGLEADDRERFRRSATKAEAFAPGHVQSPDAAADCLAGSSSSGSQRDGSPAFPPGAQRSPGPFPMARAVYLSSSPSAVYLVGFVAGGSGRR
nr:unnamed protein product [Digitaria exilis]